MSKDSPFADESLSIDPKEYLDYVRSLPCLISGKAADPHHLKAGRRRSRERVEDYMIVPLFRQYHSELHQIGPAQFEKKYNINLYKEALLILVKWIFKKYKLQEERNGQRDQRDQETG